MRASRAAACLLDVVLPPRCIHCDQPLKSSRPGVCDPCLGTFQRIASSDPGATCPRCSLVGGRTGRACWRCESWPAPLSAIAAVRYGGAAETVIRTLKYSGWRHLAVVCASEMVDLFDHGPRPDALVPVPLHPVRRRERGFNQARLIADRLHALTGIEVRDELERKRPTRSQVGLGRRERSVNVEQAFEARVGALETPTVGLIDDVATSGATLRAAAGALFAAGVTRVVGVTFALASDRGAG